MYHRIEIDTQGLMQRYSDMMDEVYLLHHTYPTQLEHLVYSPSEWSKFSEMDAIGAGLGRSAMNDIRYIQRTGKRVVLMNDPNWFNGMPRKQFRGMARPAEKRESNLGWLVAVMLSMGACWLSWTLMY